MPHFRLGLLALAGSASVMAAPAAAQHDTSRDYDLPAQSLGQSLKQVALAAHSPVIVDSELVRGHRAAPLRGRYTVEEAIDALLSGTNLHAVRIGGTIVIRPVGQGQAGEEQDPAILVTGTRIRGRAPVGSAVVTIDRTAIERSGQGSVQEIARSIPQNFSSGPNEGATGGTLSQAAGLNTGRGSSLNLRGLGPGSTLVLLNGDRPALGGPTGVFADISMIPLIAVDRIEIVPDGASAIYGSDAVAGVVNIIPRLDFAGARTSFRIGTADGDFEEYGFGQLAGARWSGGNIMVAYEYYRRDRLQASDRAYATDDLRAFGGPDRRGTYNNPGTIVAGGRTYAIPAGQNGAGLTAAMLTPGTVNRGNSWFGADLLPQQARHSVFIAARHEVLPGLRFYAHGLYSMRRFDQHLRPSSDATRTVPVTNPYYVDPLGTLQPIGVQYSFVRDLGPEGARGRVTAISGTAGFDLRLGDWSIDAHANWGRQTERDTNYNRINTPRLAAALADTNPATAYNLLGDGSFTNPATIDRVRGSIASRNRNTMWSLSLRADGPLFALPAGPVRLAMGGEYRREIYALFPTVNDVTGATPTVIAAKTLPAPREVQAGYAEVLIPVLDGTVPGLRRLDLSAAVRTERYSDFGTTTNPRLGFSWEAGLGVTLRGSYGRSFRAPGFNDLRQDPGSKLVFAYPLADPASPTGQTNVVVIRGNDPALRPERATTWTLGADIRPVTIPGLRLSATWFNVDYRDRIATPAAQLLTFLTDRATFASIIDGGPTPARIAELYADPFFVNPFGIAPSAIGAVVDARLQNLATVRQAGLDFDLAYAFDLGGGRADLGVSATYTFHIKQALTATAPATDMVDTLGNPVDLRARAHLGWTGPRWAGFVAINYVDGYTNRTGGTPAPVAAWTTFDVQLSYSMSGTGPLGGLRIALSATNVLDRDPPFAAYIAGTSTYAYDPEQASPAGRIVSLQLIKSW